MPVQLNDPNLEGFLESEGQRRGGITKAAALRVLISEARERRKATLPAESSHSDGESEETANHVVNSNSD